MTKYMLDTNICSYIIKNKPIEVLEKLKKINLDDCVISSITYAELRFWIQRNKRLHLKSRNPGSPKISEEVIENFVSHLLVTEFDNTAAKSYGIIRDYIEAKGAKVGAEDILIGAHAISLKAILVTNNIKDFKSFPGIKIENWVTGTSLHIPSQPHK